MRTTQVKILLSSIIIYLLFTSFAFAQDVDDLIYMAEDYPPANYLENGKLTPMATQNPPPVAT